MRMPLAIIVLNYRTPDLTIGCLSSLAPQMTAERCVVVVDNASGDGSADLIEEAILAHGWEWFARVVRSPVNGGFAAGNNVGIRAVRADAYILLNSDTIVRDGAIDALCEAARQNPNAGLIGPRFETADGAIDPSTFRLPSVVGELVRGSHTAPLRRLLSSFDLHQPSGDVPFEPGWIGFACVLVRRGVIDRIGLLDEGYFMYFEDVDYCRRARDAGFSILYWPEARVVHLGGGSSGVSASAARRRAPRYYYEARARYFGKFHGATGPILANLAFCAGAGISELRGLLRLGGDRPREREALDVWIHALAPLSPRQVSG